MPSGVYIRTEENKINNGRAKKGQTPWNKGKKGVQVWSEESRKKLSLSAKGINKGRKFPKKSIDHISRNSDEYKLWRRQVLSKDNYTCQKCLERGGKLESHHIENFTTKINLRFEVTNGIVFCKKCHKKFHKIFGNRKNDLEQILIYINNKNV